MGQGARAIATQTVAQRAVVTVEAGRKVLRVGGVIQSVAVDELYERDVWDAMIPHQQPANVLILGLGGGTIATLITQRWGAVPITGVEYDPAVAFLARHEFGLEALPNVEMLVEDAFRYVHRCQQRYSAICVDLYAGGKMAHGVLGGAFLRDLRRILAPGGSVYFNLWRSAYLDDQIRRIKRNFSVQNTVEIDDNIVVTCTL